MSSRDLKNRTYFYKSISRHAETNLKSLTCIYYGGRMGMKRKTLSWVIIGLIIFSQIALIKVGIASPETTVSVSPDVVTAAVGESFIVDIMVNNVSGRGLYTWTFYLNWSFNILTVADVKEGPFLAGEGYKTFFFRRIYNDQGYLKASCTLIGEPASSAAKGSGVIATVNFTVVATGSTPLHLYNTQLLEIPPEQQEIPHITEDGYFNTILPKLFLDPESIEPPSTLLTPNSSFNLTINVADIGGLYAWSLYLKWNFLTLFDVNNVFEGPFLNQEGANPTIFNWTYVEPGILYVNSTIIGEPSISVTGNGALATINFSVKSYGSTLLYLTDTRLLDITLSEIPYKSSNGYFSNILSNIVITSIHVSSDIVKAGEKVSINVSIKNEGNMAETFEVMVLANMSLAGAKNITNLDPGVEDVLTFTWDTKDALEGRYIIKAKADTLPWEWDEEDNLLVMDGFITLSVVESLPLTIILILTVVIVVVVIAMVVFLRTRKRPS